MLSRVGVLPIAVTLSPRTLTRALAAAVVCWFVPHSGLVAGVCAVVVFVTALIATALGMAHLAMLDVPVREGDVLELQSGQRGRVRAVRSYFTIVDAFDGATVLVPNNRIRATRQVTDAFSPRGSTR